MSQIFLFPLHHTVPPPSQCFPSITLFLLHHNVSSQAKIKEDKALSCDVFQHSHSRLTHGHSSKIHLKGIPQRYIKGIALPLKLQVGRSLSAAMKFNHIFSHVKHFWVI